MEGESDLNEEKQPNNLLLGFFGGFFLGGSQLLGCRSVPGGGNFCGQKARH